MVAKKKLLGLAVVLGAIAGGVIALVRMPSRTVVAQSESVVLTNVVMQVVATNAVAREVKVKGAIERSEIAERSVGLRGQMNNSTVQPSTSDPPPVKVRKPIANDPKIPKARQVLLANRRIAVEKGRSFPKKFCATQTPTARGTAPYVVISELPVSRDVRIQAVADGAKVVGFLPNNALLVEADAQALKNLEEDVLFTAAVEYEPTDKIQRALLDGEKGERVEATVVLLNPKDREAVQKFVTDNGGTLLRGAPSEKSVSANIPRELIEQLAGRAEVKWIERYGRMTAKNDLSVLPACMNVTPVWNVHGLDGTGEVVSTVDSGIDTGDATTLHADLIDRVIKIVDIAYGKPQDVYGHGTHTAGSIVGTGARSNGQYCGVAKGAKLYVMTGGDGTPSKEIMFDVSTFDEIFAPEELSYGTYIQSDSWGGACAGAYTEWCEGLDDTAWRYPELLVVMANGNDGPGSGTVEEPAAAKNCLSVGNSHSTRNGANPTVIASSSSRGPCADGRIKPDVTAPGQSIVSTRSSQSAGSGYYTTMSGTSMATPHVAGAAALVRQWLRRDRGFDNADHKPSGALLKAILTGGASGGNVPDNTFGWGRVNLEASIASAGLGVFLNDKLPFGLGSNFVFRVTTTNAAPLNVQLVWADYPGQPSSGKALVNDLDLRVTANGATWFGNGGTEPDDLNNVESVRVREAAATTYVVSVMCSAVPYDYREGGAAAIYIRGAFDPRKVKCGVPVGTVWTML